MKQHGYLLLLALAATQSSCGNAGEDLGFGVGRARPLTAIVYFDRDNSGSRTTLDTTVAGILVRLARVGVPVPLREATTALDGAIVFPGLDPGSYAAVVDSLFLSDSIVAVRAPFTIVVTAGGEPDTIEVNLAPPVVTVQQLRSTAAGQIRIVAGIVRAGRHQYSDHAVYIADSTAALRLQNVRNLNLSAVNEPGEIVRARGKVGVVNGQAVLDSAVIYIEDLGPEPLPDTLTTGFAANAAGGQRDAALINIRNATILDTTTVLEVFRVGVNDGSGRLELQLDPLGFPDRGSFVLGGQIDATGVLIPINPGVWQLWPRSSGDYVIR